MGGQGNGERDNAARGVPNTLGDRVVPSSLEFVETAIKVFGSEGIRLAAGENGPSPVDLCICGPKTRGEHGCLCAEEPTHSHPNSARFHELLKQAGEMHDRKQADYGRGDDPFANVRASEEWGISGWVGAMIRAQDKVRRLQTHSTRGSLVNESVADSLLDLAVYALIALVLYEQDTVKG